jgi:hypothetical protein
MDDVSVGETSSEGVSYPNFLRRDTKLRRVMFEALTYGALQKQDLAELHVSHGGGLSGTLRRTRPPTPADIPFSKTAGRESATDRKARPQVTMTAGSLFAGLPLSSRSPSRQQRWLSASHNGVGRWLGQEPSLDSTGSTAAAGSPWGDHDVSVGDAAAGSWVSERVGRGGRRRSHTRSAGGLLRTRSATLHLAGARPQFSRLPRMSEQLRQARRKQHAQEVRTHEKVDTDFLSSFKFTLDDGEDNYFCILYGPVIVRAQFDARSVKVGSLNAGEVVVVFESRTNEQGVKLRVALGWIPAMATNGRPALEKLERTDSRHPDCEPPSQQHRDRLISRLLPRAPSPDEPDTPVGQLNDFASRSAIEMDSLSAASPTSSCVSH